MKPKSVVTCLPSKDLERSLAFYRECFDLPELAIDDGIVAIELRNLSLFVMPQDAFDHYTQTTGLEAGFPADTIGAIHSCAIQDRNEIDHVFATVEGAGGTIAKAMHTNEWGQEIGYIRDPDGHVWELVHVTPAS